MERAPLREQSSTHRGVTWAKERGKWAAQITICGRKNHLGTFETEAAAAKAFEEAEAEHDA